MLRSFALSLTLSVAVLMPAGHPAQSTGSSVKAANTSHHATPIHKAVRHSGYIIASS